MIIDRLDQLQHYTPVVNKLDKALIWLKTQDFSSVENGKYPIDGEQVFAIVTTIEPANLADIRFEVHRTYIDCHIVLAGVETVAYAPLAELAPEIDYTRESDCQFLTGHGQLLTVESGHFWIALPTDAHWSAIQTGQSNPVRKVIVKLAVD
jgi:YhcH/YjgK/YiaL family protein